MPVLTLNSQSLWNKGIFDDIYSIYCIRLLYFQSFNSRNTDPEFKIPFLYKLGAVH